MSDGRITRGNEPAHGGVGATFIGSPLVLTPAGLVGADVAVLGAPFDDGASTRPGARFGPRAIRAADDDGSAPRRHLSLKVDPKDELTIVDYGDIEAVPGDLGRSHDALRGRLREILAADAVPLVLGGDHSLSLPTMQVLSERYGIGGFSVLHFDTHADTAASLHGVRISHGTPFRVAVEEGALLGRNVVQVGLRGTWPSEADFAWMSGQGFEVHTMDEVIERGLVAVVQDAIDFAHARAPCTYITIDIDVLDPAFAPGTGTPEPGGMTTRELLWAVRQATSSLEVCALDVVEVSPPYDHAEITAMAAHRIALEALTGIAARQKMQRSRV